MISKERLEELIEKEAMIYRIIGNEILDYKLSDGNCIDYSHNKLYYYDITNWKIYVGRLENLFETKEEAEWEIEFGKVERTERLRLPTWEELQDDLKNCEIGDYVIADNYFITLIYYNGDFNPQIVLYTNLNNYNWNMSKENYIEACKLCKKLFLGKGE